MKHYPYLFLFLFLLGGCRKDLLHWNTVTQIETGTDDKLNKILFLEDGTGLICGGSRFVPGKLLLSADQGDHWIVNPVTGATVGCYGMTVAPGGAVYCSGEYGNVFRSTDKGISFERLDLPGFYEFIGGISYTRIDRGIAVSTLARDSGTILVLDAMGKIMQQRRCLYSLNDVVMTGPDTGYIAGSGAVLRTTDGGNTWQNMPVVGDNYRRIYALDARRVYICGYNGSVVRTLDAGQHWTRLRNGNDLSKPRYHLEGIYFKDEQHGYVVGENGLVAYTDDAGQHWMEFDRFTDHTLLFIGVCPDGKLITGGEQGSLYKMIQK